MKLTEQLPRMPLFLDRRRSERLEPTTEPVRDVDLAGLRAAPFVHELAVFVAAHDGADQVLERAPRVQAATLVAVLAIGKLKGGFH